MADKRSKILEMIVADMKKDAADFDGVPFTGRTVGEYFGKQGVAIAALANIMKSILEQSADRNICPACKTQFEYDGSCMSCDPEY